MARAPSCEHFFHRIGKQHVFADILIRQLMDETAICAIFQQTPDQIGQQILMPANRRIDAAMIARTLDKPFKQSFAHAVQALKFEIARLPCPPDNRCDRQRIMRRESRADIFGCQQIARACQIRHIGRRLAREDRIVGEPTFLCVLNLGIPIRALDQADLHDAPRCRTQAIGPGDDSARAFGIRLDRHAKAVPTAKRWIARNALNNVEAHFQSRGFFGVNGQLHARRRRLYRQPSQHIGKFGHAARGLRGFIPGVECGQLNRNAMAACCIFAHRRNCILIGRKIARGVIICSRTFAQHIKACGKPAIFARVHALHRLFDIAAHDKDLPHHPHRSTNGLADKGLARARDQTLKAAAFVFAQYRFAKHQPPCCAVDQDARRLPLMRAPIGIGQLVSNQQVGGVGIGHAQERLGKREQGCAFLAAQTVFLQKPVHPAIGLRDAQLAEQALRLRDD